MNTPADKRTKRRRRFGRLVSRKWPSGRRTFMAIWHCRVMGRRLTRSFDSEKDARDFLAELERQKITDTYAPPPTHAQAARAHAASVAATLPREVPTFVGYAEDVIERRFAAVLARGTLGVYRASLRAWKARLGPQGARPALRIDEITPAVWADYRAWRAGTRNSTAGTATTVGPRTLNADQQSAVRILNEAVIDGHLAANPLAGLRKLREARRPRRYLTKEEIGRLIRAASWRFRPLVVAAVTTGARKCELLRLRWCDVSFEQAKIAVFRSKTGSSDWLDLHPMLAKELERLRDRLTRRNLPTGPADPVFRSRRGTAFTNVRKSWARAVEAAGLAGRAGLTFHALRHSFATHFLEGGGAVTDLQAQLGHAELATTQIYAAAVSERRRAAVMGMAF